MVEKSKPSFRLASASPTKVRALRIRLGLDIEEIVKQSGKCRQTIYNLEVGKEPGNEVTRNKIFLSFLVLGGESFRLLYKREMTIEDLFD